MKKKNGLIKITIIIAAIVAAIMFIPDSKCLAASAAINFLTEKTDIRVGETINIELQINADVFPGDFEGYISYNADVLEYTSGPECINGSEGILRIDDKVSVSDKNMRKYIMTFTAVGRGYCEFVMRGQPELYEFTAGYLMSVSCGSTAVQVQAVATASSECHLSALKINPGILEPSFDADTTVYNTQVPAETERLIISAAPADGEAVVQITGNDVLNVGQNRIVILVTAEDGTEKKYELYVVRGQQQTGENKPSEVPAETQAPAPGGDSTDNVREAIKAEAESEGVYITTDSRYLVCALPEGMSAPDLYTKTSIILDGITITAYTPSDDLDSDYLLLILKREGEEPGFYCYDRVEKTIQRYGSQSSKKQIMTTSNGYASMEDNALAERYDKSIGTLIVVIAILSGLCVLLLIAVIRLFIKCRGIKNDEL